MKKKSGKSPFIITYQVEIKDELVKNGFTFLSENEGGFTLLNDGNFPFNEDKEKLNKIYYTNIMRFTR